MMPEPLGGPPEWSNFMTMDADRVTSIHHVPMEQFVHEATPEGSCACGPSVVMNIIRGSDEPVPMVSHQPLDEKYYDEYGFRIEIGELECEDEDDDEWLE